MRQIVQDTPRAKMAEHVSKTQFIRAFILAPVSGDFMVICVKVSKNINTKTYLYKNVALSEFYYLLHLYLKLHLRIINALSPF